MDSQDFLVLLMLIMTIAMIVIATLFAVSVFTG